MVAVLATIGSFLVDLWSAVKPEMNPESPTAMERLSPKAGPSSITEMAPGRFALCDLRLYEPIRQKLRGRRSQLRATDAERFERLGESRDLVVVYDHATDTLSCVPQAKPPGPIVLGKPTDVMEAHRQAVIFWCSVVIALAAVLLAVVKVAQLRQCR
jgi:hypothetical protein